MKAKLHLQPLHQPQAASPEFAEPPTTAWGTAPPPPPWRGFAIAVLAHVILFGAVFGFFRPHRLPPPPDQPVIALVMQKPAPPAPPAVKKPLTPVLPLPPPVPLAPAKTVAAKPPVPRLAVNRLAVAKAAPRAPALHPAQSSTTRAAQPIIAARPDGASGNPQPVYPELSRERGEQGWVLLSVHVEPDGMPDAAIVTQSSGYPLLDNRARETVLRRWHFDPALKAGLPAASTIDLWFSFQLKN